MPLIYYYTRVSFQKLNRTGGHFSLLLLHSLCLKFSPRIKIWPKRFKSANWLLWAGWTRFFKSCLFSLFLSCNNLHQIQMGTLAARGLDELDGKEIYQSSNLLVAASNHFWSRKEPSRFAVFSLLKVSLAASEEWIKWSKVRAVECFLTVSAGCENTAISFRFSSNLFSIEKKRRRESSGRQFYAFSFSQLTRTAAAAATQQLKWKNVLQLILWLEAMDRSDGLQFTVSNRCGAERFWFLSN